MQELSRKTPNMSVCCKLAEGCAVRHSVPCVPACGALCDESGGQQRGRREVELLCAAIGQPRQGFRRPTYSSICLACWLITVHVPQCLAQANLRGAGLANSLSVLLNLRSVPAHHTSRQHTPPCPHFRPTAHFSFRSAPMSCPPRTPPLTPGSQGHDV